MSIKLLLEDRKKPWLDARVNDETIDGNLTVTGNQTVTGTIETEDGVLLPTTGGVQTEMDYFEFYSSSSNAYTGPGASGVPQNYFIQRLNNVITLGIPGLTQAAANNVVATSTEAIPAKFRPDFDMNVPIHVTDNSVIVKGGIKVAAATGIMTIGVGVATAFTATGNWGITGTTLTWVIQ